MEETKQDYRCDECGGTIGAGGAEPPESCRRKMKPEPLPRCTSAPHHERTRNTDPDEPCDIGRAHR